MTDAEVSRTLSPGKEMFCYNGQGETEKVDKQFTKLDINFFLFLRGIAIFYRSWCFQCRRRVITPRVAKW